MSGFYLIAASLALIGGVPQAEPAAQAPDDQKVTCRKFPETGSLVKSTKVCRTQAMWRKVTEAAQKTGRNLQEAGMGGPPPNQ